MAIWCLIFCIRTESAIFEYRFNSNYGHAIYDYSGNSFHGYKEMYPELNSMDCVFTDRGIFIQTNCYVRVSSPDSYFASFYIPNPSTFMVWVNSQDSSGRLFYKYKIDSCFYVDRVMDDSSVSLYFSDPLFSTPIGYADSFLAGKWNLISMCISGTSVSVYSNGLLVSSSIFNVGLLDPGAITLGSDFIQIPSLNGFVWFFTAIAEDQAHNNFMTGSSQNCFTSTCTSCSPAMNLYYLGIGCVSENLDHYTDNEGNSCNTVLSCRNNLDINCLCSSESCLYNSDNSCGCLDVTTGIAEEKACDCSPLSGQGCCSANCKTCSSSNQNTCLSCFALNSYIDAYNDCSCIDRYYGVKPLLLVTSCIQCKNDCLTCVDGTTCASCIANNAYMVNGNCICSDGYWNTTELVSIDNCIPCDESCATCSSPTTCTECKQSYYVSIQVGDLLTCLKCKEDCLTCIDGTSCLTCISNSSEIINGDCVCLTGFYNQTSLNTVDACKHCDTKCASCVDGITCIECVSDLLSIRNEQCFCLTGFWSDSNLSCVDCHSDCKTCNDSDVCNDCKDLNAIPATIGCECKDGFFYNNSSSDEKLCVGCMNDCKNCVNFTHCSECKSLNAEPKDSGGCECKDFYANNTGLTLEESCYPCANNQKSEEGICLCPNLSESCLSLCETFSISGTCEECKPKSELYEGSCKCLNSELIINLECSSLYFEVFLSINLKNEIKLTFSKNLKNSLNKSNLKLTSFDNPDIYFLNKVSESVYLIELEENKSSRVVKIEFIDEIISEDSSIFIKKILQVRTFEITESKSNQVFYENLASNGMLFGLGVSLSIGFIQLDLSSFYNLMNFGEIYSLISLYGLDLHPDLLAYLINLRVKKELPSALVSFAKINLKSESEQIFKDYGFETSLFCVNSGMNLLILLALLIIFFLQKIILSGLAKKVKIISLIKNYFEYNAFLRFFIQSFLDLLISCSYSLKHITVSSLSGAYDLYLSLLFITCQFYFYIYSIFLIYERKKIMQNEEVEKFENKFESLFKNFRSWKTRRVLFYLIFTTKRYFLTAFVFFINDSVLKLILSFTLSATVFFYLFYFNCFKSRFNNFVHYYNELSTMIVYFTIFISFIFDSPESKFNSMIIVIGLINISQGINIIFAVYGLFVLIKNKLCAKAEKNNKVGPRFVEVEKNVEEVKENCLKADSSEIDLSRISEMGKPNSLRDDMSDLEGKEIGSAMKSFMKGDSIYLDPYFLSNFRESKYLRNNVDFYRDSKEHESFDEKNIEFYRSSEAMISNSFKSDSFESEKES